MRKWLCLLPLLVLLGCETNYGGDYRYEDDGRAKAVVEVIPLIDSSHHDLPWDLSREITEEIRHHMRHTGKVVLTASPKRPLLGHMPKEQLFGKDLSFAQGIRGPEYLVLVDLTEHRELPYVRRKIKPVYPVRGEAGEVLTMTVNLRVLDLRGDAPAVILQQVMPSNHLIPKGKERVNMDYEGMGPHHHNYLATPVGRAHSRLARDIAEKVATYVRFSRG